MATKYVKTEYLGEYIEWAGAQGIEYIYIRILPEKIVSWDAQKTLLRISFTVLKRECRKKMGCTVEISPLCAKSMKYDF
jgi:hypothetical protein